MLTVRRVRDGSYAVRGGFDWWWISAHLLVTVRVRREVWEVVRTLWRGGRRARRVSTRVSAVRG